MKYLYTLLFLICSQATSASVVIVANINDGALKLNQQEIRNLFMGGALTYSLKAISLPPKSEARVLFNTKVIGLTESRIQSYWAQMRFSGRKKPPLQVESEQALVNYLLANKNTIGYLSKHDKIPEGLTVIYHVEDG